MFLSSSIISSFNSCVARYIADNITRARVLNPIRTLPDDLRGKIDITTLNGVIVKAETNGIVTPEEMDRLIEAAEDRVRERQTGSIEQQRAFMEEIQRATRSVQVENLPPLHIPP